MPGFDFSRAKMREWKTPLPERPHAIAQYVMKAVWEDARLSTDIVCFVPNPEANDLLCHRYHLECEPAFAVMMADENLALGLWKRRSELDLKCGHFIIDESDWILSLRENEVYVGDPNIEVKKYRDLVHYVLGGDNDFLHIVCSEEPRFADCGFEPYRSNSDRGMSSLQLLLGPKDFTKPRGEPTDISTKPKTRH